ncbi:SAP5 [Ecytonucleospora hepatopenaei]|uniref:SAP5 n=1 Tax=Ecytonucleospora hepatopenaei TaxID=646526 RepID=A0A1W0E6G8_9MICR|nr:SAP5 [Ecytonucleospora hepatopenaei]
MVLDKIHKSDSTEKILNKEDKYTDLCTGSKISPVAFKRKLVLSESTEKEVKVRKTEDKKIKNTCFFCNKKLKIFNTYQCRCGKDFCNRHRFFDQHDCAFDIKNESKKILERNNPKVAPRKL